MNSRPIIIPRPARLRVPECPSANPRPFHHMAAEPLGSFGNVFAGHGVDDRHHRRTPTALSPYVVRAHPRGTRS